MSCPDPSTYLSRTNGAGEQHCIRFTLLLYLFSKAVLAGLAYERVCLFWMLWTFLEVDFVGAVKSLELLCDVLLD
jgi:hypothetical protein